MTRHHANPVATAALSCILAGLLCPAARAQVSAWLDFDGAIHGDSTSVGHVGWILVQGFNFGGARSISAGSAGGSRESSNPSLSEISLTKALDVSSSYLFAAATAGNTPYPKVTLDLNYGANVPSVRLELEGVFVSALSCSMGQDSATESISLNFTKITYTYISPDSKTTSVSYDIATGTGSTGGTQDSDNDGMPDDWEIAHGLTVGINDANGDLDGDGLTNLQEYQLGTDPNSGTSFFKAVLSSDPATPGTYQISWNSVVGKTYVIEWSPDLKTPFTALRTVTASATTSTESIANAGAAGFYRVRPQ